MSVLTCPVCQGAMREVERNGVLIDTCTQCRGVWLDRGELEKLAGALGGGGGGGATFAAAPPYDARGDRPSYDERRRRHGDDDDDDGRFGDDPRRRSKTSRFLDFFD